MEIRLHHPKHGYQVAHNTNTLEYLKANGWSIDESYGKPLIKVINDLVDIGRDIEELKAKYLAKFGKKPHHMAKLETIQKALDDDSE